MALYRNRPGVMRRLVPPELPADPPGQVVHGFTYDSPERREHYASANRELYGHRVVEITLPTGELAAFIFIRMPDGD